MRAKIIQSGSLLALLLIVAAPVRSDNTPPPPLTEQSYLQEFPVVLTPARLSQRVDTSPLPITVITRQMIWTSGATTVEDVLRLVPGMLVGHENGNQAFVTYDGFADRYSRRMQVLVDGRSVYSPSFGGVDWSSLPVALEDIDRIEVIRGPDAAAYGANSFLGVINIITRKAAAEQGNFSKVVVGSDHLNRVVARHGGHNGNLNYRITAVTTGDHGFDIQDGIVDSAPTNGYVDNKQTSMLTGRFDYQGNDAHRVSFQFGDSYGWRDQGGPLDITYPPHRLNTGWNFQQIDWKQNKPGADGLSFRFYHQLDQTSERFQTLPITIPTVGVLVGNINYDIRSNRYDAELQQIASVSPDFRVVWGVGSGLDQVISQSYFGTSRPINDREYRLFGHGEWDITRSLYTNIGAMLEHADFGGTALSPTASLNYTVSPGHTLRLSAASATRNPVPIEQQSDQSFSAGPVFDQVLLSSGNLGPERIRTLDFGYVGDLGSPTIWLDTRVFHSQVRDLIEYYNIPYPADNFDGKAENFRNGSGADLDGAEFQINYNPGIRTHLVLNYAYLNISSPTVDASGPHHNFSALFMHRLRNKVDFSAAFYFTSHMSGLDTGTYIGAQRRLDLKMSVPFSALSPNARVGITLQSVLGSYQDFKYVNVFEPAVLLTLTSRF